MLRRDFLQMSLSGLALSFTPYSLSATKNSGLKGYIRTNWSQDPFSYGSYSYFAKGSSRSEARALAKPVAGRLYFAGEATHPKYNSTVHAAYESGELAASAAIKAGHSNIAIIGAGVSGLSAAHSLAKDSRQVTVYEGRDRIGGRIWTDQSLGLPLDLGASWIHGVSGNPIAKLAKDLNFKLDTTDDSYLIRGRDGQIVEESDAPEWFEEVVEIQHSSGADLDLINQWAYWKDDDYDGVDKTFRNGYTQIFEGLKGAYSVQLNKSITRIKTTDSGVVLSNANGVESKFDAVILTVPLGVLKKGTIAFDPLLPSEKLSAIQALGMGTLDKVYLKFDRPFWDKEITWIGTLDGGLPNGEFNQWLNLYRYTGEPIIMAFNGGSHALTLAQLDDEAVLKKALKALTAAYPSALS